MNCKKILCSLLVAAALVFSMSAVCFSEGAVVATDANGVEYTTLSEALSKSGTVTLQADIHLTQTVTVASNLTVTLDLNGYDITVGLAEDSTEETVKHINAIVNNGTLTLEDSAGGGSVAAHNALQNTGTLRVYGGTYTGIDSSGGALYSTDGSVYIYDGAVLQCDGSYAIYNVDSFLRVNGGIITGGTYGIYTKKEGSLNANDLYLYGGTISGTDYGVYSSGTRLYAGYYASGGSSVVKSTVTVTGGIAAVRSGQYVGSMVFNGGTYQVTGKENTTCYAIRAYNNISIYDGWFGPAENAVISSGPTIGHGYATANANIYGGTFVSLTETGSIAGGGPSYCGHYYIQGGTYHKPSGAVASLSSSYIQKGYALDKTTGEVVACVAKIGTVGYATLEEAVANASSGATVTLCREVKSFPVIDKSITIKGEGDYVIVNCDLIDVFSDFEGTVKFQNLVFYGTVSAAHDGLSLVFEDCSFVVPSDKSAIVAGAVSAESDDQALKSLSLTNCGIDLSSSNQTYTDEYLIDAQCVGTLSVKNTSIDGEGLYEGAIFTGASDEIATVATISGNNISGVAQGVTVGNSKEGSSVTVSANSFTNLVQTEAACGAVTLSADVTSDVSVSMTKNAVTGAELLHNASNVSANDVITSFTDNTQNGNDMILDASGNVRRDAPAAIVSVAQPLTLEASDYRVWKGGNTLVAATEALSLEVVMNFKATETLTEAKLSPFAKWRCDFYVTVEGLTAPVYGKDCLLAGNYGSYGWIAIPLDTKLIENNLSYPVVTNYDPKLTYENICDYVRDFTAAIHIDPEILLANPDFKVTLELKMKNPDNESDILVVGDAATYDAKALLTDEIQVVLVDDGVVVRNLAENETAQLVVASYLEKQLKAVSYGTVGNGTYTLAEDSDAVTVDRTDGAIIRAFLWEKDTLVPLCIGDEK